MTLNSEKSYLDILGEQCCYSSITVHLLQLGIEITLQLQFSSVLHVYIYRCFPSSECQELLRNSAKCGF